MRQEEMKEIRDFVEEVFQKIEDAKEQISLCNYGMAREILARPLPTITIAPDPIFKVGDTIRHKSLSDSYGRKIKEIRNYKYYFDDFFGLSFKFQDDYEVVSSPTPQISK